MKITPETVIRTGWALVAAGLIIVALSLFALRAINGELARRKTFKATTDAESFQISGGTNCSVSVDGCKTWHQVTFTGTNQMSDMITLPVKAGQTIEIRYGK